MASLDFDGEMDLEMLGLHVSNNENKKLEGEVEEKQKDIEVHQVKIDQHTERIQAITDHLKNVRQELRHTQVSLTKPHIKGLVCPFQ